MRINPNIMQNMVSLMDQAQQNVNNAALELSTGRKVNVPSDNPSAEASMIQENAQATAVDQYTSNSDALNARLSTANSTISEVVTLMQRALTLATEGASSGLSQTNLNSLATEVSGIKSQVMSLANTSYGGNYLFGGTYNAGPPYSVDSTDSTKVDYNGNDGQNQVQIGTGLSVHANQPGSTIFSQSGSSVFDALQSLVTALQSGDTTSISTAQTSVTNALNTVNTAQVFYGNTLNELTNNDTFLSQEKVNLTTYENSLVAADTATAATDMTQASTTLNATIAAAAKVTQVSLMDYIK
ncbi:MAG: flagellar hook-associated protein FlgL [Acidobacteriota bacterium]|nr:flagellar hook-associated protein FlgL [Acidobacteriota bacterium]